MRVSQLIEMLGGTTQVAQMCDVASPVVSNWKMRNSIPAQHWRAIVLDAKRRKIAVTYELLGQIHASTHCEPDRASAQE
jgi:hypothetical protein